VVACSSAFNHSSSSLTFPTALVLPHIPTLTTLYCVSPFTVSAPIHLFCPWALSLISRQGCDPPKQAPQHILKRLIGRAHNRQSIVTIYRNSINHFYGGFDILSIIFPILTIYTFSIKSCYSYLNIISILSPIISFYRLTIATLDRHLYIKYIEISYNISYKGSLYFAIPNVSPVMPHLDNRTVPSMLLAGTSWWNNTLHQ